MQQDAKPTWSRLKRLGLIGLAFTTAVAPVVAQRPSQAQIGAIRQSCRADYQSYCASVPTGGSAALACLQQNAANLSPACQQAVGAVGGSSALPQSSQAAPAGSPPASMPPRMSPRQRAAALRQACGIDYRSFCRGVRPGGGRAIACLRDNAQSLSPGCQDALMAVRPPR